MVTPKCKYSQPASPSHLAATNAWRSLERPTGLEASCLPQGYRRCSCERGWKCFHRIDKLFAAIYAVNEGHIHRKRCNLAHGRRRSACAIASGAGMNFGYRTSPNPLPNHPGPDNPAARHHRNGSQLPRLRAWPAARAGLLRGEAHFAARFVVETTV